MKKKDKTAEIELLDSYDDNSSIELLTFEDDTTITNVSKRKKSKKYLLFFAIFATLILLVSSSYAWYTINLDSDKTNTIRVGDLKVGLTGNNESLTLTSAVPTSDNKGLSSTPYKFSISNTGNLSSTYLVILKDLDLTDGQTRLEDSYIKYELIKDGISSGVNLLSSLDKNDSGRILATGTIDTNEVINFELKIWIDANSDNGVQGKVFSANIVLNAEQLNGTPNEAKLAENMIPVKYDDTNNTVIKADSMNTSKWYNYDNLEYANSVYINDSNKLDTYKKAAVGTVIDQNDIRAYYVWIPRFSFSLKKNYGVKLEGANEVSLKTPGAFDIKFVPKNTTDNGTGDYDAAVAGNFITPVGFCFGDSCMNDSTTSPVSGLWISKFMVSSDGTNVSSIPTTTPLTTKSVSEFYNLINTNFSLSSNADTHMIKNSEWSLMAYLAQSKYGIYGNKNYTLDDKIIKSINTSYNFISDCVYSTTGNNTGIYDISNYAREYVMGNNSDNLGKSSFTSMPSRKYYDYFETTDYETSCNGKRCLGQNIESRNFYSSTYFYPTPKYPFMIRGNDYTNLDALFKVGADTGEASSNTSTRSVIIVK